MCAPLASACSRSSSTSTADPSAATKPSRSRSNGRDACSGSSLRVDSARAAANIAIPVDVIPASVPPASTATASPCRIQLAAWPIASAPEAHALTTAMFGPRAPATVSIELGARGPNMAVVSACASGADAIGQAANWIRQGDAVAVLAGGTEAGITSTGIAMFAAARALSTRNDDPEHASRPFERDRDGFVAAEGSAVLVLEEREHALARGATIYAELLGYAASADAHHITAPEPSGDGAVRCVRRAIERAGKRPEDIEYINAHGTGTPLNDLAETRALKQVFGDSAYKVPISSTKSMTGHMLGAAGAFEAMVTILALRDGFVPPTVNLEHPDPECDLDYVPNSGRAVNSRLVMTTSFGFGGHNACLVFAKELTPA